MGVRSPAALWDVLTPQEWADWVRFANLEPFGALPYAQSQAYLAHVLAACHGATLSIPEIVEQLGYAPINPEPRRKLTLDEERALIAAQVRAKL